MQNDRAAKSTSASPISGETSGTASISASTTSRLAPDHIFFILVLLLTSVLILMGSVWSPSPSFTYSLRRLVLVATMFTIAHSITFTLAGLDLIPLPALEIGRNADCAVDRRGGAAQPPPSARAS